MDKIKSQTLLDCDAGRELGCKSFCCRLLVRLEEHERNEIDPASKRLKGFVGKKENGKCIHQDEKTGLCANWENRPKICRQYNCNFDKLLQVVIRSNSNRLADWMKESVEIDIEENDYRYVPFIE